MSLGTHPGRAAPPPPLCLVLPWLVLSWAGIIQPLFLPGEPESTLLRFHSWCRNTSSPHWPTGARPPKEGRVESPLCLPCCVLFWALTTLHSKAP